MRVSCQIQPPGPRYVLQLLFSEKSKKLLTTQKPLNLEKNEHRFEILWILEIFHVRSSKFQNYPILQNRIIHRFLLTTKQFSWWNILITIFEEDLT